MRRFTLKTSFFTLALFTACTALAQAPVNSLDKSTESIVREGNILALQLYGLLKGEKDNVVISPYAISASMGLPFAGAEGGTEAQMARVLRFRPAQSIVNASFGLLNDRLYGDAPYFLSIGLWLQKGPVKPEFKDTIEKEYHASLKVVDFVTRADSVRADMNSWMKERTQGKITNLVEYKSLPSSTRMAVLSGAFVKGRWAQPFNLQNSKQSAFFRDRYLTVTAPTMFMRGSFNYFREEAFSMIELPYEVKKSASAGISLFILLPHETYGLSQLEDMVTTDNIKLWQSSMQKKNVFLSMPRFSLTDSYSLEEVFKKMGLTGPFKDDADFSAIRDLPDLKLSLVVHKAAYSVDEWGSEVGLSYGESSQWDNSHPVSFAVDHPFMFFVIDTGTGSILMIGRMNAPS